MAKPIGTAKGLIQGSIETDLNEQGHVNRRELWPHCLPHGRDRLDGFEFVVSPQRRAMQTVDYIITALGLPRRHQD